SMVPLTFCRSGDYEMGLGAFFQRFGFALKLSLAAIFLTASLYSPAQAQFAGSSGSRAASTVEQARTLRVGSKVSLTGSLKKEIRRAQYLFQDKTGEIRVRIEREVWRSRKVTSYTKIKL